MLKIPKRVQLSKSVIEDIFNESSKIKNCKMLVFGLGNDSIMWNELTNGNTIFIENYQKWIDLNKTILNQNIIKYEYTGITVESSLNLLKQPEDILIHNKLPFEIENKGPFDIILIDGPQGYKPNLPGRLYPIVWSLTRLSKPGTLVYIDDSNRQLESKCITAFLKYPSKIIKYFKEREGSVKIKI